MIVFPDEIAAISRRRRREGGAIDPLGTGNSLLIAALGGNASVPALYDVRKNVTLSGSTVVGWDDVRGASSGFGPTLVGTAHAPAWDSTNLLITGDGSTTYLLSSAVAAFAVNGAMSLFCVSTFPVNSGSGGQYACGIGALVAIANGVTASRFIRALFNGTFATSVVGASTTRRVAIASKDASTTGALDAPSQAQVTATITDPASGNRALGVCCPGSAANFCPAAVRAVGVVSHKVSSTEVTAIANWAVNFHGVTLG